MFELIKISEKCYYINCPAKIGIYKQSETDVYLIDSGNDKDAGRKVRKILDEIRTPMPTISAEINIFSSKPGAKYLQMALKRLLRNILF